ncbi:MAG TPA: hypothetical protein DCY25_10630 [Bacteroidales bacterium]|nr:hypothetical protein [Bacteroidales bacterium]
MVPEEDIWQKEMHKEYHLCRKLRNLLRRKNKAMALRKTDETKVRSLTKIAGGSSYAVTIPIDYIRKLKWRGKQKLEVKLYQDRIIIRDWKP